MFYIMCENEKQEFHFKFFGKGKSEMEKQKKVLQKDGFHILGFIVMKPCKNLKKRL